MLGLSTHKPDISSFQSIEFHLTQNYINSQENLSFRNQNNDPQYSNEPASLTYTMSHQQIKQTITYEQTNKQNLEFKANLCVKTIIKAKPAQDIQEPNMKRKKSILNIQNLELEVPQISIQRQSKCVMRLKKKSLSKQKTSFSSSRKRISSNASNASLFSQVSSLKKNPSRDQRSFSQNKIQLSHLSTQDKSIIFQKENSFDKIKESLDMKQSRVLTRKIKSYSQNRSNKDRYHPYNLKMNLQTKRKSIVRQNDNQLMANLKVQNTLLRKKQNCFLQDGFQDKIGSALQVQSIKLEQNKAQSKLYLRKIIQCRVSVQHYAQTSRRYQ